MDSHRFNSAADLASRARSIDIPNAWKAYRRSRVPFNRSCSYSLETRKFYDGDMSQDRKDLVELYGDGGTLYIIVPWSNTEDELYEEDAMNNCEKIVKMGHVPFIGIWYHKGRLYEEPSFPIDHGIPEPDLLALLERFDQIAAYCVRYGSAEYIKRDRLGAGL